MRGIFELLVQKSIKKAAKRIALCFVERSRIFFVSFPDKVVVQFDFPTSAVSDADVVNKEEYRSAVFEWVRSNPLKVSDIIYVVSENLIFSKDYKPDSKMRGPSQEMLNSFIEVVPFQRVYTSKISNKDGSTKLVVTNKDIVSVVVRAFDFVGFNSLGVFPEFSIISDSADPTNSQNILDQAQKHVDLYTVHPYDGFAFYTSSEPQAKPLSQMSVTEAAQAPINPLVAVVVVVVIVGFALYFVYWKFEQIRIAEIAATRQRIEMLAAEQSKNNKPVPVSAETVVQNQPTQAPVTQIAEPTKSLAKAKIQIVYSDSTARIYELVRSSIVNTYGYEVDGAITSNQTQEGKILVNDKTVDSVITNVKNILDSAKVSYGQTSRASIDEYDLVLTIGKTSPEAPTQVITTKP
ncbi:MAG: hypothetical protein U0525_01920 [Patescibacteria group bacterium]